MSSQRFLRGKRQVPRRKRRLGVRRRVLLLTAAVAGLVVGWIGARATWGALRDADALRIKHVKIEGARRAHGERLERKLEAIVGDNILTADLARVRDLLAEEPWVKDATVQRVFPDRLVAHVVEHTAVAVEAHSGQLIDESGSVIAGSSTAEADGPLPAITGATDSQASLIALRLLQTLELADLPLVERVRSIDVSDPSDVRLALHGSGHTLRLGCEAFPTRLNRYLNVESLIAERFPEARSVDLRFDGRVVVAPVPEH